MSENLKDIEIVIHTALDFAPISDSTKHKIKEIYPLIKSELFFQCEKRKMLPFVAKLMIQLGIDTNGWRGVLESYRARNRKAKQELEDVFEALVENGITNCYPIENFAALLASEEDLGLFASGDIDVYAGQANHDTVHEVMSALGYTRTVANEYQGYYYSKATSPVDINMMWMWQSRRNMPFRTMLDTQNITGGGTNSSIPQLPADELMYMCLLHASVHHYICEPGIKLYFDIGLLARKNVNWHNILRMADNDRYTTRIQTVARIAAEAVNAAIPDWVIADYRKEQKRRNRIDHILHGPNGKLKYRLNHAEILRIEALSDDVSVARKVMQMLCPDRLWIRQKYGKPILLGYFKHILKDLGG